MQFLNGQKTIAAALLECTNGFFSTDYNFMLAPILIEQLTGTLRACRPNGRTVDVDVSVPGKHLI